MKREDVIRLFPEQIREILRQADWNPEELPEAADEGTWH